MSIKNQSESDRSPQMSYVLYASHCLFALSFKLLPSWSQSCLLSLEPGITLLASESFGMCNFLFLVHVLLEVVDKTLVFDGRLMGD